MDKSLLTVTTLALMLAGCSQTSPLVVPATPFAISGFSTPESVRYDASIDVYLVSNINGAGLARDNNGFISRVSPDGTVLNKTFIGGGVGGVTLNAPKGMAIVDNTLYVADIDTLRLFNRTTGAPLKNIDFPGSSFLNDVAAAPDGSVYVSDTGLDATFAPSGTDAIYKVSPAGVVKKIASGAALNLPNGLAVLPSGKVQVVPFGSNEIYTVTDAGVVADRRTLPGGQLDGVELYDGGMLISSWETSSVYFVNSAGAVSTLASNLASPADLGLDTRRNRVMVPLFMDDKVQVIGAR